ncbi:response regulator transcription factor [Turicimonas muris]|uniref:response regulator transcription factor n=1 Tax=Turicimonas muris TaxID=1796652 RepID=UPI0026756738|nr:response regulator [Turicimonas muris]
MEDAPSRIGCIVLDVKMPKMSGLQLQERLNELGMPCPIVFLTGHGDIDMAVQTMREGACDFLQKPIKQETFLPAIERAIKKDRQARAGATDMIHERHILASLTPREEDVCRLVAEGLTSVLIASRLNISKRTVDVIRTAALKKLTLENLMN